MAVADSPPEATTAAHGVAPGTVILGGLPREPRRLASAPRRSERRPRAPTIIPTIPTTRLRRRPVATIPILPAIERRFAHHAFAGKEARRQTSIELTEQRPDGLKDK